MKIKVSTKNRYGFTPDVFGNMEQAEKSRWVIYFKKPSWYESVEAMGSDLGKWSRKLIENCFLDMENAPVLEIGGKERELEISDIFEIPELSPVATAVNVFVKKLIAPEGEEVKNL